MAKHTIALMLTRMTLTLILLPVLTGSSVAADATGSASAMVVRAGTLLSGVTGDVRIRLPGSASISQAGAQAGDLVASTPAQSGAAAEALQESCRGDGCANPPDDGQLQGDPVYTLVLSPSPGEDYSRPQLVIMFN